MLHKLGAVIQPFPLSFNALIVAVSSINSSNNNDGACLLACLLALVLLAGHLVSKFPLTFVYSPVDVLSWCLGGSGYCAFLLASLTFMVSVLVGVGLLPVARAHLHHGTRRCSLLPLVSAACICWRSSEHVI